MSTVRPLSADERLAWLRLARSERVGPITFRELLGRYGSAGAALEALPGLAQRGGARARGYRPCPERQAREEIRRLQALGASLCALCEPGYPGALRQLEDAPPLLAMLGATHLPASPMVAIVGARNASAGGVRLVRDLAAGLGAAGWIIVSGMARGIDAAAHVATLDTGTIAVLGGGVDVVFPPENEELYRGIAGRGLLLAESPPGTRPLASHFPRRNRIIAGLVRGVVVVEASLRSGSLITARLALDAGREVMAVPGSPLDPRSRGCNALVRQGAALVEDAGDVLGILAGTGGGLSIPDGPFPGMAPDVPALPAAPEDRDLDHVRTRLLAALSPVPASIDGLADYLGLEAGDVLAALLELELAGHVGRHPGGRVALAPGAGQEADG